MVKRLSLIGVALCALAVAVFVASPLLAAKPTTASRGDRILAQYERAKAKLIRLQNMKLQKLERQFNHVVEQKIAAGETEELATYVANMNRKLNRILAKGEQKLRRKAGFTNGRLMKIGDPRILDPEVEVLDLPIHDPLDPLVPPGP